MTALCKSAGVLQPPETLPPIVVCFGSREKGCAALSGAVIKMWVSASKSAETQDYALRKNTGENKRRG